MKETIIEVTGEVKLTYNEKSNEFKDSLEGYIECIDRQGSVSSMLQHVAFYVTRFGIEGMIEGVGYVGYDGKKSDKTPYSGIIVGRYYDEFNFEIV